MGQNILSALFLYFLFGWLVPAALKGNSLRDKQKFSWLATLSTLTSKLNTQKCLIVPLLIRNGRILIFVRKKTLEAGFIPDANLSPNGQGKFTLMVCVCCWEEDSGVADD